MAARKKKHDIAALEAEYKSLAVRASVFTDELTKQLARLVADSGVALAFPIQCRVKQWDSLAEKFRRVALPAQSLVEVQDLVGLRVILLFRRDLDVVDEAIRDALRVVRVYDTGQRLKEDQFGYSSRHYVVGLPPEWLKVPTFAGMDDLVAEVQVRTLAQHMWAEASQVLQYKREDSVPASVRRALYRGSAILETLDLEFDRVLHERDEYRQRADVDAAYAVLNVDLLEKVLDAALPPQNKAVDESYAELLSDLNQLGITTVDELQRLIRRRLKEAENDERRNVERTREQLEKGEEPSGTSRERVKLGVYFSHVGLVRVMLTHEFGRETLIRLWAERTQRVLARPRKTGAKKRSQRRKSK